MGSRRKRVAGTVKLEIEAGRATPAPPVGRDLGPYGIDIGEFVRRYNDATRDQMGTVIPAVVTIYEDRSFSFITKTPPTAVLLREAAGIDKGAAMPNREAAGTVTPEQIRSIAERKIPDLNAGSIEAAMKIIEGSARSMGVRVAG
jgi:large subunit ribosomal protein L11